MRAGSLRRRLAAQRPLSLYVHIPFCASPCCSCECNRVITPQPTRVDAYLRPLAQEIALAAQLWGHRASAQRLHFGGDTDGTRVDDRVEHRQPRRDTRPER